MTIENQKVSAMTEFEKDVLHGLCLPHRRLPSKYFYDDAGSRIFQEIMAMPEYYLTDAEEEVFRGGAEEILESIGTDRGIQVLELGAGDGAKTLHLLRAFKNELGDRIEYHPIDISQEALDISVERMASALPGLHVSPLRGDYFKVLEELPDSQDGRLILFLGSNIGNYEHPRDTELMQHMADLMRHGDHLLLGADLRKNPNIIRRAYADSHGITRRFNMNLLTRMNREFGADFDLDRWDFYCRYTPEDGEVRSYLVSLEEQSVDIPALERTFDFGRYELVWTELSKKFTLDELVTLGSSAGLVTKQHFMDAQGHFSDTLYMKP